MAVERILFVCGSLEPGHDGVGDYTRSLAGAIKSKGVESRIISIMDRNVNNSLVEIQESKGQSVKVLRISKNLSLKQRKNHYLTFIENFNPTWVSLQYVPYAFSPKGVPLNLTAFLKLESCHVKWHFMIHEAFISNRSFKGSIIENLQVLVLKKLVKSLKPLVIHTSIRSYQNQLKTIGIRSDILGLFGNIPIINKPIEIESAKTFRGVYFGAPPTEGDFEIFVDSIDQYLDKSDDKIEITLCGQSGERGRAFAATLRECVKSTQLTVAEKGRMSEEDLSMLFFKIDFGIARIPPQLIGKSGSAIALLEHGVPMWIPLAKSQAEIEENCDYRIGQCFADLLALKSANSLFDSESRLDEIANSFLQKLSCT